MFKIDLTERIHNNRLLQIGQSFKCDKSKARSAVFLCDCGERQIIQIRAVRSGRTKSCGCLMPEKRESATTTHGATKGDKPTSTYKTWNSMMERCRANPGTKDWHNYVSRGISVCGRWSSFQNFLDDMGEKPQGMSLDRISNTGNYTADNCRWATVTTQNRNKRSNVFLEYNGETLCISEWSERLNIGKTTLHNRIVSGWSVDRALSTPARSQKSKQ